MLMNYGGRVLYQFDRNNLSMVLHVTHQHIGSVTIVKQCITEDIFPHILANAVDIQKVHLLLHSPLLNKTPRLSSVRTFVRLYRLLLMHCTYVSVTKHNMPSFYCLVKYWCHQILEGDRRICLFV